jgi:hypothetical protein
MIMGWWGMASDFPPGLGERGSRLWRDTTASGSLTPAHLVLLEEACRLADRLDWLNAIVLRWMSPVNADDEEDGPNSGGIQQLLAEARQQATALRGLLAEIRQGLKGSAAPASNQAEGAGGSGVSDLSARIAERRKQAQG